MGQFLRTIFSKRFLFYTNCLGSGFLMCVGDTIQQSVEIYNKENKSGYDLTRIAHMGTIGLLLGPPTHFFYKYLDHFIPKITFKTIAYKILVDQSIISPTCIIIFLGGLGILESKTKQEIKDEIKTKFLIIYSTDWMLWPPCQYVNFTYVKPKYRVMYVNVITVIYDIILSYIKYTEDLFKSKEKPLKSLETQDTRSDEKLVAIIIHDKDEKSRQMMKGEK
uniref:Mpv17-like protein 2 n=1 Tax=Cacopsylla melanoneura TaxID=428564 RepID=A0A8D9ELN0_9HEMI